MGLACSEVPDVQLFLFLLEGVALLEDTRISGGPEASLLPGLSGDTLALGGMSPFTGTCVLGLSANMKEKGKCRHLRGLHSSTHGATAKFSCGMGQRQEGAAMRRETQPATCTLATLWKP